MLPLQPSTAVRVLMTAIVTGAACGNAAAQAPTTTSYDPTKCLRATKGPRIGDMWEQEYFWLSSSRLLVLTHNPQHVLADDKVSPEAPVTTPSHFMALLADYPNGPVRLATYLNGRYADLLHGEQNEWHHYGDVREPAPHQEIAPPETRYSPPRCTVSPNGEWMLFYQSDAHAWIVGSLSGPRKAVWQQPGETPNPVIWKRDSRHWLELVTVLNDKYQRPESSHIVEHDVDNPGWSAEYVLSEAVRGNPVGFTDAGNLITVEPLSDLEHHQTYSFFVVRFDRKNNDGSPLPATQTQLATINYGISMPKMSGMFAHVEECCMTRAGDRLALIVGAFPETCGRMPHGSHEYHVYTFDLRRWLCEEIGQMPRNMRVCSTPEEAMAKPIGIIEGAPVHWQWMPDGKRLSFALDEVLYTMPVPAQAEPPTPRHPQSP